MKRLSLVAALLLAVTFTSTSAYAYPYCGGGWGGGYHCGGGYYRGCGGWYGSGIPNGLGWALFGVGAAAAIAAPVAYAAPAYYSTPAYYSPAPSMGYYQPSDRPVVVQRTVVRRVVQAAPQSDTLAKVQSKLAALGYYKGSIDGSFGPQTEIAVSSFQSENNLPVTGRIDLKTLSSLGVTL